MIERTHPYPFVLPRPKLYPYSLLAARTAVVGKHGEESGMRSVIMGQGRMICLIAIGMHLPVCGGISNWAP